MSSLFLPPKRISVHHESPDPPGGYRDAWRSERGLTIVHRGPRSFGLAVLACAILWNALVFQSASTSADLADFLVARGLPIIAGIAAMYLAIALLVNRTRITVREGVLRVMRGPLRWPGARALRVDGIRKIECAKKVHAEVSFEISALDASGWSTHLLSVSEEEDALFLRECLGEYLETRGNC